MKNLIGMFISDFGTVEDFSINTKEKSVSCKLHLVGEPEVLNLYINRYALKEDEGKCFFVVEELSTSKEWLSLLAKKYVEGRAFEIPQQYSYLVKLL